tara:strand:+ start:42 stop:1535 length:1494 start_codon:yes stop_codon:yes gene_type:complete
MNIYCRVTTIIILLLLLILCNTFINIDKRIIEGLNFSCNNLFSSTIKFDDLPSDMITTDNSLNVNYMDEIYEYIDLCNNITNIINDITLNMSLNTNNFCLFSNKLLPIYNICSSETCYTQINDDTNENSYNDSINKTLSIGSRSNTFITLMKTRLMYFDDILYNIMNDLRTHIADKIDTPIVQKLQTIKNDLDSISNSSNNNSYLTTSLQSNNILLPFTLPSTEGFTDFTDLCYNMVKTDCGNPCNTNINTSDITCNDCTGILNRPGPFDITLNELDQKIESAITDFSNNIMGVKENITNIATKTLKYVTYLDALVDEFKDKIAICSNTTFLFNSDDLTNLKNINSVEALNLWNINQIKSNLPTLNYTSYTDTLNTNNNISTLLNTINTQYTSLYTFASTVQSTLKSLLDYLENQKTGTDNYINSLNCGINTILTTIEQGETKQDFSLLDNFTNNLLVPNIFTIFNKGSNDSTNSFGDFDLGKIISDGLLPQKMIFN